MSLEFWHDWNFVNVNWVNFTVIDLAGEINFMDGTGEIEIALLGLHLRLQWISNREANAAFIAEMNRRMEEAKAHPEMLVPLSEVFKEEDE
jgi:hypothetical protein